jgi:hypothetical protein
MKWVAKPTGNMTLGIIEGKRIIVRVDMLSQNTMVAGDEGEKLCRSLNDLSAIAACANGEVIELPYDSGLSALPWTISKSLKSYSIRDRYGHSVCSQRLTGENISQVEKDFNIIEKAIIALDCKYNVEIVGRNV